jgi:hypothetical protein
MFNGTISCVARIQINAVVGHGFRWNPVAAKGSFALGIWEATAPYREYLWGTSPFLWVCNSWGIYRRNEIRTAN